MLENLSWLGPTAMAVVSVVVVILLFMANYLKAKPDEVFIISGVKKNPRILIGRGGLKIPFFERVDKHSTI